MHNFTPRKSDVAGLGGFEPTRTQVHLAKFCDINNMISRALAGDNSVFRTGGTFADLTDMPDSLQDALNAQRLALESYNDLPENVKQMYPNPQAFFAASLDPDNRETFKKLGLLLPEEAPASPVKVEVINNTSTDVDSQSKDR